MRVAAAALAILSFTACSRDPNVVKQTVSGKRQQVL